MVRKVLTAFLALCRTLPGQLWSALVGIFWSELARHLYRKVLLVIPLLIGVVTLIFLLIELSPGSVIDKFIIPGETSPELEAVLRAKWHLDDPIWLRYIFMMKNLAMLDFGESMDQGRPVFDVIFESLPNTILLSIVTLSVIYPVGLLFGSIQAIRRGRPVDTIISVGSLFFYSMPAFWLGLMMQLIFAYYLDLLPISGMTDSVMYDYMTPAQQWRDLLWHIFLPGIAMGVAHAAGVARYMRSSLLEVIQQDYIRTARAKGLSELRVMAKHAFRNSLLPIITLFGLSLPIVFSGSVLVETIFAWPGMGRTIIAAIFAQDTPLIIGCFFVYTLVVVVGNLLADVLYAVADPRIRYS